jgi:Tol biopolymer transport system component
MPGNKIPLTFLLLVLCLFFLGCKRESTIAYPGPIPSGSMMTFLPGIVSTDSFEFNSMYSLDGKRFYFSKDEIYDIYETTYDGAQWSAPAITTFCEKKFKECDPAFSPDGTRLFYISTRPVSPNDSTDDFNIWFVDKQGDEWSQPKNLEAVNSDSSEFYVSFARNGNLYFASNRAGGLGSFDIYVSRLVQGIYTAPVNLGDSINDDHFEHDPFISRDEKLLIFTSVNRAGGLGRGDLYYSIKDESGNWCKARNLGAPFSTPDYDFCPYITPDGLYFFFSDNKDIKWIDAQQLYKVTGHLQEPSKPGAM